MKNWLQKYSFPNRLWIVAIVVILFLLVPAAEETLTSWLYPWEDLPAPPARPVELLGTGGGVGSSLYTIETESGQKYVIGDLFILAGDGQIYGYEQYDGSWRTSPAEQVENRETCDRYGPWFSKKTGECVQATDWESPGVMHRFLLDSEGNVWHWVDHAPVFPSFLVCGFSGLVIGNIVFLIMFLIKTSRNKAEQE